MLQNRQWLRQVGWFAALWLGGVLGVVLVGLVIRLILAA